MQTGGRKEQLLSSLAALVALGESSLLLQVSLGPLFRVMSYQPLSIASTTGNDGAKGAFYTSGPGNAIDGISVASLDNTVIPLQNATVHGVSHAPITYFDALPLPINGTLPIFATSNSTTVEDDACDPLPDDTPDLSKFIVIVRRGTCTFVSLYSLCEDQRSHH